jgi:hypothetical protein
MPGSRHAPVLRCRVQASRTRLCKLAALDTVGSLQRQLRLWQLRFWVGAPTAAQPASLQKDVGAHAWPIVHRHTLHVKHDAAPSLHF